MMDTASELLELVKRNSPEDVSRVEELFEEWWDKYINGAIAFNYEVVSSAYSYLNEFRKPTS